MRIGSAGAVLLIAAFVPATARAQATVSFDAEFAKAAAKPHVPFKAGGVEWSCTTTRCTGRGSGKDPVSTCRALPPILGYLKSFTAAGNPVDLHACGAAPSRTVVMAAPTSHTAPVATVKPATGAAAASAAAVHTPAPAAAPSKKGSAPAGGLAWTAGAMTLTGTGTAGPPSSFKPISWSAPSMTLTGTGATPVTHATALTWTADTMKLTGVP
jgi:hypothetical protein